MDWGAVGGVFWATVPQVKSLPYVVGFEEADLRGTVGRNVYVRNLQAEPGQRVAIVRPSQTFRNYNGGKGRDNDHSNRVRNC